ncbi:hypothetical protein Kisp01_36700 [Kineosporia sp. NBRC 101677]|nr:hypothetical protein Kisp01_36700 [Kineosporia sp. NBRC 101677]
MDYLDNPLLPARSPVRVVRFYAALRELPDPVAAPADAALMNAVWDLGTRAACKPLCTMCLVVAADSTANSAPVGRFSVTSDPNLTATNGCLLLANVLSSTRGQPT